MKLFSKRNRQNTEFNERERTFSRIPVRMLKRRQELISEETRNRIISQIRFLSTSKDFLEGYILAEDKDTGKSCLNGPLLDEFSLAELGYEFSVNFDFRNVSIVGKKFSDDDEQALVTIYDDSRLFDILEVLILFAKETKREEVIDRMNKIFIEESEQWIIIRYLVTKNTGDDLDNIINQLKDSKLKAKLKSFQSFFEDDDYINSAKLSSDILNIIFSDFLEDKKDAIEKVLINVCTKVVEQENGEKDKKQEMKNYLDELLKNSKNLVNNIFDVRHTEKHTIKVANPYIYKLISSNNISLIEFVLTSLKDEFIVSENWEEIKNTYIEKYNIDKNTNYVYESTIIIDDIPF